MGVPAIRLLESCIVSGLCANHLENIVSRYGADRMARVSDSRGPAKASGMDSLNLPVERYSDLQYGFASSPNKILAI